jgi:hypothetical protein
MPIITKPSFVRKNIVSIFSLNKNELALHPKVVASTHFKNTSVWDRVTIKYKSLTLGQFETVTFDAATLQPFGQYYVSPIAENIFQVEKVSIIDKDGAILLIPRTELTVADFDIDLNVYAPTNLSYSSPLVFFKDIAVTQTNPTVTGFVESYSISPSLPTGLTFNTTTGAITGTPTELVVPSNYLVTATNETGSISTTISIEVTNLIQFPIVWDLNIKTQTLNSDGGITGSGFSTPSVLSPSPALFSSDSVTSNFKITYKVNLTTYSFSNDSYVNVGMCRFYSPEGNSGSAVGKYNTGIGVSNSRIAIFANGTMIKDRNFINGTGANNFFPTGISILEIERTGTSISIFLNSDLIHTFQMPFESIELFPWAEVQTGFEVLEAYYNQDPIKTYFLSNTYKSNNLLVSNNNKSVEAISLDSLGFGTVLVSPFFSARNALAKYYSEFTIDNKMPNSQMSFGFAILQESTTGINVANLSGTGPIGTPGAGSSFALNIEYFNSQMLYNNSQGNGVNFTINTGDTIGLFFEMQSLYANVSGNLFVKIYKNGSIVSTTNFSNWNRNTNCFFAFSPHLVGDKITLKDSPDYIMPAGTTYIQPAII